MRRVLLVEDDYYIARAQTRALSLYRVQVIGPAATLDDALRLAADEQLDGAVLDINLRGLNVYPVADLLQSRGVPFVFLTGYDDPPIPAQLQAMPWCQKPVGVGKLVELLFGSIGLPNA
jgi:DNA-binding response OmpR family regulator